MPKGTDCAIDVQGANADVIRISVLADDLQSVAMMAGASPANILSDQHDTDLTMLHLALAYLSEAARKTVETFSLEALSNALSVHIVARYAEPGEQARGTLSARRLQRVTGYVMDHITGPITLAEMAEVAGISLYHFSHVFAATMGVTPHRYVMATRVSIAVKLISTTNVSLVEIADQCGFSDQSHLSRWIKLSMELCQSSYVFPVFDFYMPICQQHMFLSVHDDKRTQSASLEEAVRAPLIRVPISAV